MIAGYVGAKAMNLSFMRQISCILLGFVAYKQWNKCDTYFTSVRWCPSGKKFARRICKSVPKRPRACWIEFIWYRTPGKSKIAAQCSVYVHKTCD